MLSLTVLAAWWHRLSPPRCQFYFVGCSRFDCMAHAQASRLEHSISHAHVGEKCMHWLCSLPLQSVYQNWLSHFAVYKSALEALTCVECVSELVSGEKARIMSVEWTSDSDLVVLEVPQEGSKASTDSDRTSWKNLLQELESEAEIIDVTINSHELKRMETQEGALLSNWLLQCVPATHSFLLSIISDLSFWICWRRRWLWDPPKTEDVSLPVDPSLIAQHVQVGISGFCLPCRGVFLMF